MIRVVGYKEGILVKAGGGRRRDASLEVGPKLVS